MMREAAFRLKTAAGGRSSTAAYRDFLVVDALPPEEAIELSAQRSAAHARFAFEHSAFYRELYSAHGFSAEDLRDPASFSSLPIVDKTMLRENFESIRTDEADARTSVVSKTGGSTGLPLHLLRDLRFPARALEWRLFDWWGVKPWDDRAIVTRHVLTGAARLRHDLGWLPSRRVQLDAFQITDDAVRAFVERWNRVEPRFLIGYGGGVLDTVRRMRRLGLRVVPPAAVAVTAAPLSPGTRAEIEDAFGAPCYDHYRSAEIPWMAGECAEQSGLHVFSDVRRIEIVDEADRVLPEGREGEVIVSDLTNRVFPIVRYRLGDISSYRPGVCACGRGLPRLGAISGRSSDAVRLPDGTTIAGALGHIFDDAPLSIRQFEIVQDSDYAVTLRCIPADGQDVQAGIDGAEAKLRHATRGLVPVRVERVDHIPQVGGKMRFIRSSVGTDLSGDPS
ncbi:MULTISPECIES: phenylacetate--CoA ligase family protein [Microbacterium]|uniref:phenylacetate--CoA ligase family protein n=1 Tax=Microbacterium TaxID=33882 RepID=UPI000AE2736E|nr:MULTISPECIES: phenylacetate--CoA ligase family protein [Microbacterium]MCT1394364.1 phenylacetate--CoA ligase family protein [Microbacterium sp. p3-SID338]QXE30412.1 phenylacetate--CoA ligase family protein [Microbacterium paraoxydans]RUQ06742.1 phenylacetate--CoA ligase family protein [Microbacterium sp. HSID17254]